MTSLKELPKPRSREFSNANRQVAKDMIRNAKRIVGEEVDWEFVLNHIQGVSIIGDRTRGEEAMSFSIARTVGSVVHFMGWDMAEPEVVYMSVYYFAHKLGEQADTLSQILGTVKITKNSSDDTQVTNSTDRRETLAKLGASSEIFRKASERYAFQNLPQPALYTEVLQALLLKLRGNSSTATQRKKVLDLLKKGEIAEAHKIVCE